MSSETAVRHCDYRSGFLSDLFCMDGRVVLITGGHGALAEAMASTLADLGCDIALAARKQEQCEAIAEDLHARFGHKAIGLRCDVSEEEEVVNAVAATLSAFGRMDVLINNAGASWWGLPHEIPLSGWKKVIDVNLTGTFLCCREAARHMIANGGGSIINIASAGAYLSYTPEVGQVVPYTTSKAGIVHLTRDLAAQWAEHAIRVNAIAPGSIETGMTETLDEATQHNMRVSILMRRFGRPVEIAGVVATLASNAGSFITGQTFVVDGGQSIA